MARQQDVRSRFGLKHRLFRKFSYNFGDVVRAPKVRVLSVKQFTEETEEQQLNLQTTLRDDALYATETGNLENLKEAIDRGFDPYQKHSLWLDRTPFLIAAEVGHLQIVEYLIQDGADVNAKDSYGKTALHLAAEGGHLEIVEYLIGKGVQVDLRDYFDRTPLHLARNRKICRVLVENGADVNAEDLNLWRPLHFGAMAGSKRKVYFLLANGAHANSVDLDGNTPFHVAADYGWRSLKILLPFMEENLCNGQNQTVYDLIRQNYGGQPSFKKFSYFLRKIEGLRGIPVLLKTLPEPRKLDFEIFDHLINYARWFINYQTPVNFINPNPREIFNVLRELEETKLKDEYLKNLLEKYAHPPIHWVLDGHTGCEVAVRVKMFVNYFLEKAAEIDSRFAGTIEPIGSCAEGSKLGKTDEFDFLLAIKDVKAELHFSDPDSDSEQEGLVRLTKGDARNRWKPFLDNDNMLEARYFAKYFFLLLWETSRRLKSSINFGLSFRKVVRLQSHRTDYPHHAVPLVRKMKAGCKLRLRCQITGLSIDVDVVPAIKIQGWPQHYTRPFEQLRKVLPASVIEKESSYCTVHAISNYKGWELSFATTEKKIISNCGEPLLNALRILKILKIPQEYHHHSTLLNSYTMKTGLLHYFSSIEQDSANSITLREAIVTILQILRDKIVINPNEDSRFYIESFFVSESKLLESYGSQDLHELTSWFAEVESAMTFLPEEIGEEPIERLFCSGKCTRL